jgi:hypothetical protein
MAAAARARPLDMAVLVVTYEIWAVIGLALTGLMAHLVRVPASAGGVAAGAVAITGIATGLGMFFSLGLYVGILVTSYFLWRGSNWARIGLMFFLVAAVGQASARLVGGPGQGVCLLLWDLGRGACSSCPLQVPYHFVCLLILLSKPVREYCNR